MKLSKFCNKISLILQALWCAVLYFLIEALCRHSVVEAWDYMTGKPLVFAQLHAKSPFYLLSSSSSVSTFSFISFYFASYSFSASTLAAGALFTKFGLFSIPSQRAISLVSLSCSFVSLSSSFSLSTRSSRGI